jgi:hypothetical protein
MQANKWGTDAEQKRYAMNWMTATQRPQCGTCRHCTVHGEKLNNYRCERGNFATAKSAICDKYEV